MTAPQIFARLHLVACVAVFTCSAPRAKAADALHTDFQPHGLQSIDFAGTPLLKRGEPKLRRIVWDSGESSIVAGDFVPTSTFDAETRHLRQIWTGGTLDCTYRPSTDRLDVSLTFTNTSDRRIRALEMGAMDFVFPETPTGNGWFQDLHYVSDGIDDVAAVLAHYGPGTLAVAAKNSDREVELSIEKDFEHARPGYNLLVSTISRDTTDRTHVDGCRLDPGQSMTFEISLRFGAAEADLRQLAGDLYAGYAKEHPRVLRWRDRRPIAMLMLASVAPQHHSATNPRGWLNNPRLDVVTAAGRENFQQKMRQWADRSVEQCRQRNAQGAVIWDVEGEQFRPIVYVGDPRKVGELAPEFDAVADEVFKRFADAGLRTGVCIRPSRVVRPTPGAPWQHVHMAFDPVDEMAAKIGYAKKRWGCTLFYIDTNVTFAYAAKTHNATDEPQSWVQRAHLMRDLARRHPDVLILPEFQYVGYYSHVSGYKELRQGYAATPERVRLAYPDAFSVINVSEGAIRDRRPELVAAVRRGDILMFRGWFDAPENAAVESIYREAYEPQTPR